PELNYDLKLVVNNSIQQTLTRSIFTSATTFVMVLFLYILGVESMRAFALPIAIGIIAGAFSSVFISGNLYYIMTKKKDRYNAHAAAKAAKTAATVADGEGTVEAVNAVTEADGGVEEVKKITANPNRKKKKKRKQ
ncbi:MAG: protein translocase subunit SecDF, partial [Lachnospiraceae bacterium]|nr:protein translocase subunit SecDF [Lachnospiraceae bacterium]